MSSYSPQQASQPSPAVSSATFGHGVGASNVAATTGSHPRQSQPHRATPYGNNNSRPQANAAPQVPTDTAHVIQGPSGRILCVADVRGNLKNLNSLAAQHDASAIIHTGDFGFYTNESLERISDKTLRHLVQYSTLIPPNVRTSLLGSDNGRGPAGVANSAGSLSTQAMRSQIQSSPSPLLSEFPLLLSGALKLDVPVFTIWGACEDVAVLEKFRLGEYQVPNLQILDEATTRAIEVGGVRLRLFGLGGAVVYHKLFDNGEGAATIAGGQGTMWTTILQIGELIDTAQKISDPSEVRVFITHASPGREGLLTQIALALKADLTISAGLHFRYGLSYNEFSVQHDTENFRNKLVHAKAAFGEIWDTVKSQVEAVTDANQKVLLGHALSATNRVPPLATATGAASEEPAWKNTWNWNLPDAAYGSLVLDIKDGRVGSEMRSQGFNFGYRKSPAVPANVPAPTVANTASPATAATGPSSTSGPVKTIPAGPSATHVRSPPLGPKGAGFASPRAGPGANAAPRSQHQRAGTGGSGILSSSDSEQLKTKGHFGNKAAKPQHQRGGTEGSGKESSSKEAPSNASTKNGKASGVRDSVAAVGDAVANAVNKVKRPRGGKSKGGAGGSKSGIEGDETSGAEGLTSGAEGQGGKKDSGKPKKREEKQQQQQRQPTKDGEVANVVEKGNSSSAGEAKDAENKASDASGAAGAKSGEESGTKDGNSTRGGRGGGRGGRGGGRGGRGRGKPSVGGGGGAASTDASGGATAGGGATRAPAVNAPAATNGSS